MNVTAQSLRPGERLRRGTVVGEVVRQARRTTFVRVLVLDGEDVTADPDVEPIVVQIPRQARVAFVPRPLVDEEPGPDLSEAGEHDWRL